MVEYFNSHLHTFWFVVGFSLLAIEILVLGFSTGFVLFLGFSALLTGGFVWFELIPQTWLSSIATFSISSVLISIILWKPFKKLEKNRPETEKDNTSDIIGLQFRVDKDITHINPGTTRYSGISWRVEIDTNSEIELIKAGSLVNVVSVDAGKFRVLPVTVSDDH